MTVTPEELAAFADGELAEPRRSQIAAEIAQDGALAAEVERHRALKDRLGAHFAPILDQPVPEELKALLVGGKAKVADLTAARQRRAFPRWGWVAAPALAASLALAVFLPGGTSEGYAGSELAAVLDDRLVAQQGGDEPVRVLLSFRDEAGAYCRAFTGAEQGGIACRDQTGWQLRFETEGADGQGTDYRMAGADPAELLERAQDMAVGAALNSSQEEAAKAAGWR
jgi:hypothetical protein